MFRWRSYGINLLNMHQRCICFKMWRFLLLKIFTFIIWCLNVYRSISKESMFCNSIYVLIWSIGWCWQILNSINNLLTNCLQIKGRFHHIIKQSCLTFSCLSFVKCILHVIVSIIVCYWRVQWILK